jgi:hypothetical protein
MPRPKRGRREEVMTIVVYYDTLACAVRLRVSVVGVMCDGEKLIKSLSSTLIFDPQKGEHNNKIDISKVRLKPCLFPYIV